MNNLSIEQRTTAAGTDWVLVGELDLHTVPTAAAVFQAAASRSGGDDLRLDLVRLEFIGFAALDLLVDLSHQLAARGRRLVVTSTPLLRRVALLAEVELVPASDTTVEIPPQRSRRVPRDSPTHAA